MTTPRVRYLVFDVESAADGALISRIRYPGENLSPADAIRRYRDELMAKYETDFIPYTFQVPIAVSIAKVGGDFRLIDLVSLDEPQFRPHILTEHFWRGWEVYRHPTLVSFNGRTFDIPLLELAAFRYGIGLANWFNMTGKSYEQPRNRYNLGHHLDLHDVLTNFGACKFTGGLNLAENIVGKPGKMAIQGYMVQDLRDQGRSAEVADYCRCDVLDTYFVFLRSSVLLGTLTLDAEQQLVAETKQWLAERADKNPVYAEYLSQWGDWQNPWAGKGPGETERSAKG